jgi:hypothetical protein
MARGRSVFSHAFVYQYVLHSYQAEFFLEPMDAQFVVMVAALPLEFHASKTHAYPGIELLKQPPIR